MIHEIKATFFHTKPLVFYRKQDSSQIVDHKQH